MKFILITLLSLILFSSCTKEVDLNLNNKSGNIVIEGNITNQQGPYIIRITRSVAFTDANKYPAVTSALVIVSDNTGVIDTLTYIADGKYKTNKIIGTTGNTYALKVFYNNISYTAKSTMPSPVELSGLLQDSISFGGNTTYTVLPQFIDPIALGHRYFFIVSTTGKDEKITEVFSDNINNGVANQRSIVLSFNNTDSDLEIKKGDTIDVEMRCIENNLYTYYSSLIQLSDGGPGGGVTPSNPPSNINNGALGYFSAHATDTKKMIIR